MGKIQRSKTRSIPTFQFLKRSLTFEDFKGQFKGTPFLWIPYKTGLQWPCALLSHFHFSSACSWHVATPGKRGKRESKLARLFLQISSNEINLPFRKAGSHCLQTYKRTNSDSMSLFLAPNNSGCSWKD